MDILIALIPALCWGNIGLISALMGGSPKEQTLGMTTGALLVSLLITFFFRENFAAACTAELWITGFTMGFFWCAGQFLQFVSLKAVGVSKGYPVSTGGQLVLNAAAGAVIFGEWKTGRELGFGFLAVIILALGAAFTAYKEKKAVLSADGSGNNTEKAGENWKTGVPALIFSTLFYGVYTIISTWKNLDAKAIILPQSIGMVTGALIFGLRKGSLTVHTLKNLLTGLLFSVGNLFLLISITKCGLAISFSLSQTGVILSTFGAIFILHEKKTGKEMIFVIAGVVFIILGALILGGLKQ